MNDTIESLQERVRFLESKLKVVMGLLGRIDSRLDHTDEKLKYAPLARKADSNEARVTQFV
jgi:hypothetical protein